MKKLNTLLMLLVAATLTGVVSARADESAAINTLNNQWDAAVNQSDTRQLVSLYADDAVMLPPSSEILSDRDAIKNYWDDLRAVGVDDFNISMIDVRIEGNQAYQTALWEATRNADGNVIQFNGNMSNVLERQKDGNWKIKLQSWN